MPVAVILFVSVFMLNILIKPKNTPSTSATPAPDTKTARFGSLVPGTSSQTDVNGVLGRPVSTKQQGTMTVSEFRSSNQYRFHEVIFQNGTAVLIKQIINSNDNLDSSFVTNQFGSAPFKLYENLSNSSFSLYIYPQNGIAYLGHTDGTLKEIWYFEPSSFEDFNSKWASDFSQKPPEEDEIIH